jgi:hypothetical protein
VASVSADLVPLCRELRYVDGDNSNCDFVTEKTPKFGASACFFFDSSCIASLICDTDHQCMMSNESQHKELHMKINNIVRTDPR